MKTAKVIIIALVTLFTFGAANAQVRVHATIGARPQHRTVIVHRPYHRTVVVRRHYYHRPYHRPYYRHHYYRHH